MPIYSLKCTSCKFNYEAFMQMDSELPDCPKCGNVMKKVFSLPSRSMREYHGGIVDYDLTGERQVFRTYEELKSAGKKLGQELV